MGLSVRVRNCWPGGVPVVLALAMGVSAARAEIRPDWKPDELIPRSDVVLLGTESAPTELRVDRVLKGSWQGKQIEVPDLPAFRKEPSRWAGRKEAPTLTGQCVVFVTLRYGRPRVVANGVYRIAVGGGVLGYAQEFNPGGYELQA